MKTLLILSALLMVGCATHRPTVAPSTTGVARSLAAASVGTVRAQASAQKARVSIKTATEAVTVLRKSATPEQRPAVSIVAGALTAADRQVSETEAELITVSNALIESDSRVDALQGEVNTLAQDRDAQALKARESTSAYHRLKFWLAAAGAGLAFLAVLRLVPPLIPYRWGIAAGAGVTAFGAIWVIL